MPESDLSERGRRAPGEDHPVIAARRGRGAGTCPPALLSATLAVLVAACQPAARRALLLDLTLADPIVLGGTAEPWHDAGYTIEYRQFYPHLARADLERYRTLILLLGREPEASSDALTAGDLALLHEWLLVGGVVVLGYDADGEGGLDRWTANRWLDFEGTGIAIGDQLLEDSTARIATTTGHPQPWAEALRVGDEPLGSVYRPFPLDRNDAIATRARAQLLAVTGPQAFIRTPQGPAPRAGAGVAAASRVAAGLVVVISRHALGALGPQFRPTTAPMLEPEALTRTHDFLTALARWTRRPAEWAHLPPASRAVALVLEPAPAPLDLTPPPATAPPRVSSVTLPVAKRPEFARAPRRPPWLRQHGVRALWAPLLLTSEGHPVARPARALDSLVDFLDAGGFNLFAGDAAPDATDSVHARREDRDAVRHAWADAVTRLEPTSVAWIPAFDVAAARWAAGDQSRGPRSEAVAAPCAFDSLLWAGGLIPAYTALGRLAAEQRTLVIALGLDLSAWHTAGLEFCDAAWHRALARMVRTTALEGLPYPARYPTLRDAGLLALYYRALEDEVAERATALQQRVLRLRSDLFFAFRLPQLPADWFTLGLLRGFALADRPMLVFTPELRTRAALAAYRARDLDVVHAVELVPATLRTRDWIGLKRLIFEANDGFWLMAPAEHAASNPDGRRLSTDSLTLLIRRLAR